MYVRTLGERSRRRDLQADRSPSPGAYHHALAGDAGSHQMSLSPLFTRRRGLVIESLHSGRQLARVRLSTGGLVSARHHRGPDCRWPELSNDGSAATASPVHAAPPRQPRVLSGLAAMTLGRMSSVGRSAPRLAQLYERRTIGVQDGHQSVRGLRGYAASRAAR